MCIEYRKIVRRAVCPAHQPGKYQPNATLCMHPESSQGLSGRATPQRCGAAGPEDKHHILAGEWDDVENDQKPGEHCSDMLFEELFGFVDLRSQVRAAAAVGVVEQHELAVLLGDLVLSQSALTVDGKINWLDSSNDIVSR